MTYTLQDAEKLAEELFKRNTDYSGVPYTDHLKAVAASLEMFDEDLQVVGMLHSVLERTDWTAPMLLDEGVPAASCEAIQLLTRDRRTQTWAAYFRQIRNHEDASLVKIACTAHNVLPGRVVSIHPRHQAERITARGFAQRHLWTTVYEDDLRDVLKAVNPDLLVAVEELKKDGKL